MHRSGFGPLEEYTILWETPSNTRKKSGKQSGHLTFYREFRARRARQFMAACHSGQPPRRAAALARAAWRRGDERGAERSRRAEAELAPRLLASHLFAPHLLASHLCSHLTCARGLPACARISPVLAPHLACSRLA